MWNSKRYARLSLLFVSSAIVLHAPKATSQTVLSSTSETLTGREQHAIAQDLDRLNTTLNLSKSQQTAVLPLLQELQAKLKTLDLSSADRATRVDGKHSMVAATNAQIRAVLSESQQPLFDSLCSSPRGGIFSK